MIAVAGAGMAGLVAAARLRELGRDVSVREKGTRLGGSMLLSSCVVWRHRDFDAFRAECPGGDERLQRLVWERLDDAIGWLVARGAPVVWEETGNPRTVGKRFEPAGLVAAHAGDAELGADGCVDGPLILCTGGFGGSGELVERFVAPAAPLRLRANPWSAGDGLRLAVGRGAALTNAMDEFYGRNMPAPPARVEEAGFVPLAQLYARFATVENEHGERFETRTWSEIDVAQWTARQPRARARYLVADDALGERVRERTVAEIVEAARAAGGPVERRGGVTCVGVTAAITTTLGGLRIDTSARVAEGVFAAGADAGGVSTGGYSSGLAAALVQGRIAAEAALGH